MHFQFKRVKFCENFYQLVGFETPSSKHRVVSAFVIYTTSLYVRSVQLSSRRVQVNVETRLVQTPLFDWSITFFKFLPNFRSTITFDLILNFESKFNTAIDGPKPV